MALTGLLLGISLLLLAGGQLLAAPTAQFPVSDAAAAQGLSIANPIGDAFFQVEPTVTATLTATTPTPIPTLVMPSTDAPAPEIDDNWATPVNLSLSGATTDPQIIVDSNGRFHALWRDAFDGFAYAIGDGFAWSESVIVETPFSTRRYFPELDPDSPTPRFTPYLVADTRGSIHAFWTDNTLGTEPVLYHSSVQAGQFNNINAWSERQQLDSAAISPSAAAEASGRVHVAYVRTQESGGRPAGIYYQVLSTGGSWSGPTSVYTSRYLRGLPADAANVSIALGGDQEVFLAWDDPGREQVFVANSSDGGQSWPAAVEIDRRGAGDSIDAPGPRNIAVGALPGSAIVTWGAGHDAGSNCTQYYRNYVSEGNSWAPAQSLEQLPGCLDRSHFLSDGAILFVLGTVGDDSQQSATSTISYLLPWNGNRWGSAEVQSDLNTFINPDTNQPLTFGCQQGVLRAGRLHLITCDRGTGSDIWSTSRALGEIEGWFPPPPIWQGPETITSNAVPPQNLQLVSDAIGNTHAFWSDGQSGEIFHMRWDGQAWSSPFPILTAPQGIVSEISATTFTDRLYLAGRDQRGIFFSAATTDRPTEWSTPATIVGVQSSAVDPAFFADNSGLFLTYAVPLNEQRGVYLIRSSDAGVTWSEPRQAFDGTAAGWDMVDGPELVKSEGGDMHLTWLRRSLPPDAAPLALAYSRSNDIGFTWSEAASVVEASVVWDRLFSQGDRVLHRVWVENDNGRHLIWHALSIDDGLTWSEATQVTSLDEGELPAAAMDPVGRLQLLAVNDGRLLSWVWDGTAWQIDESLRTSLIDGGALSASADVTGRLVSLYVGRPPGTTADTTTRDFSAMWRPLSFPNESLPVPPTLTPAPPATPTAAPSPTPEPTPTLVIPGAVNQGPLSQIPGANSQVGQLAFAIIPAALVVLLVSIVGFRAMRKGRG